MYKVLIKVVVVSLVLLFTERSAWSATKTWSGAVSGNWNTAGNWTSNAVPVNGDDLVFPTGVSRILTTNDMVFLNLNSILFTGSNFVVRGNSITLTNNLTMAALSGTSTVALATVLTTNITVTVVSGSTLDLSGTVSGEGGFTKTGLGTLVLSAPNLFLGNVDVTRGTLLLSSPSGEAIHQNNVLTIGDGLGGANADIVRYTAPNQINTAVIILINNSGLLDLNGANDLIGAMRFNGGNAQTGTGIMTLNSSVSCLGVVSNLSTLSGRVSLGFNNPFQITNGPTGLGLHVAAEIRGSGGIVKSGPGRLTLTSSNFYSGLTTINEGILRIENDFALGTPTNGTVVNLGGALLVGGSAGSLSELLTLNGNGPSNNGALQAEGGVEWNTNVVLATDSMINSTPSSLLTINGTISGSANLTKVGAGGLRFSGSTANTYTGTTFVKDGRLELNKSILNGAVIGPLVIGDGLSAAESDVVLLNAATQIQNDVPVTINSSGLLNQDNFQDAVGSISGNGHIHIGSAFLNVGFNDTSTEFSGIISGAGGDLSKLGSGTLILSGTNTHTGVTTVSGGTLLVNGSQAQSPVSVSGSGTLGGTGIVGWVTNSGIIAPGSSPGILTTSNLTCTASGSLRIELNGILSGTGYDALRVRGTNILGNSTLNVSVHPDFVPIEDVPLTLINNDGSEPISGIFAGFPEGSSISATPFKFRVSYFGGSGNDVTLTLSDPPLLIIGAQVSGGNGNSLVDANECNHLSLILSNTVGTALTNISAELSSSSTGVLITQPRSAYLNIGTGAKGTNVTAFQISTAPSFNCGTMIPLTLRITTASGSFVSRFSLPSSDIPPLQFNNNTSVLVTNQTFTFSTNVVLGISNAIEKVTVSMYISHVNDSELSMSLIAPDGTTVLLSSANGGPGDGYGTNCAQASRTTFDDSAFSFITNALAPFVGTFRPQQPLAAFIGQSGTNVNGPWRLRVGDTGAANAGTLHCWSLTLSPACTDGGGGCEFCPGLFAGSIDNSDTVQNARMNLSDTGSTCLSSNSCPGIGLVTNLHYDSYRFTNNKPHAVCITATLTALCGIGKAVFPVTYINHFDPANICSNYLADLGFGLGQNVTFAYSFSVPASSVFIVVVSEASANVGCSNYVLAVSGFECPTPALDITKIPSNKVWLDWPTSAAGYLLETAAGLTPPNWVPVTNQPIVIGTRFNVTNNVVNTNHFYRLRKPL
jgi:autotransporter-associated beta strand protein